MKTLVGTVIHDDVYLTLDEICRAVKADDVLIAQFIEYQIIEPKGRVREEWQFDAIALKRARLARNFYHDLEVNVAGIGVVLDLLDRIALLEKELEKR